MKTDTYKNRKKSTAFLLVRIVFLLAYFALLLSATFLNREPEPEHMAWLTLFGSFRRAWDERHAFIFWGIVANFMMMLPLGFLLGWGKRGLSFGKVLLCAAATSFLIECIQYLTRLGYFDVDDILTNIWGAAAGGGFCWSLRELTGSICRERVPRWGRILAGVLPFTAFFIFFGYFLLRMQQ